MERAGEGGVDVGENVGRYQCRSLGFGYVGSRPFKAMTIERAWAVAIGLIVGSTLAIAVGHVVDPVSAGDCFGAIAAIFG